MMIRIHLELMTLAKLVKFQQACICHQPTVQHTIFIRNLEVLGGSLQWNAHCFSCSEEKIL